MATTDFVPDEEAFPFTATASILSTSFYQVKLLYSSTTYETVGGPGRSPDGSL